MYLRPGNLYKEFQVKRLENTIAENGFPVRRYKDTGSLINGILAKTNTGERKHQWAQEQHLLTHTVISRGRPAAKKGDLLVMNDRSFIVLTADDTGGLGEVTLYYVEERNDLR